MKLSRRAFFAAATAGAIAAPVAAKAMPEIKPGRVEPLPFRMWKHNLDMQRLYNDRLSAQSECLSLIPRHQVFIES